MPEDTKPNNRRGWGGVRRGGEGVVVLYCGINVSVPLTETRGDSSTRSSSRATDSNYRQAL